VNDRWEVALGLTDGSGFQQAKGPAAIHWNRYPVASQRIVDGS
jgi:hypothetical protein